ncbi:thiolase family protein [Roseovarius sp.]|uniref:thiolase family protein n=1 Tax=Roseovarius sp. TaxID=1486281 RepID=UPI0035655E17
MSKRSFPEVYIVGAGQAVYEKKSERSVQRLLYEASDAALASAGLPWSDVDGLGVACFRLPPDNVTTVAEHFGLAPRFLFHGVYGGASGIVGMLHAARAIQNGDAEVVVVATADSFNVTAHNETVDNFNVSVRDFMSPQGFAGPNGMFALHTRLYMQRTGAREEDFGQFCISLRENALRNPNALFKKPLTMEDYLSAKRIADPLRLFDCVMPCVGGDAVVLASARVAERLSVPKVAILAGGERHNYPADDIYAPYSGWEAYAGQLYERAGVSPGDMDFAQVYDDYPVMSFIQLEGLGICQQGDAFRFVREQDITWRGDFPVNTGGGQLSAGQAGASGGMIGVVEGVLQLRGEGGERQVANARRGVVSGYGMVAYGRGLSTSAAILERVED